MNWNVARDSAIDRCRNILTFGGVILDTETTGLDGSAEVVQVAIIDLDGNVLFDSLVKPLHKIPMDAYRIHGITNERVEGATSYKVVEKMIQDVIGQNWVLAYNADFDQRILIQTAKMVYADWQFWQAAKFIDIMVPYSKFVGEWNDYRGDWKWQRLPGGDHSALGDCRATLELIKYMAEMPKSVEENHA